MEFTVPYITFTFTVLLAIHAVFAEEECARSSGSAIKCYECTSSEDINCSDPFNFTSPPSHIECAGCCVKIVQFDKTPNKTIRRTCTKKLKINLFMVDHVCMLESNGQGHMCFCEDDDCNGGPSAKLARSASWQLAVGLGLVSATLLYD